MGTEAEAIKSIEGMFGGGDEPDKDLPAEETVEEEAAPAEEREAESPQGEVTQGKPEDEVEVEIDGERYLVPKKISDRFIQHADYTRKTMDVAEMRRALSAEREVMRIEQAFGQASAAERKQLAQLEAQIERYRAIDWSQLDTEQLLRTRAQLDQLKDAHAEVEKAIKDKRADFEGKIRDASAQAVQAGQNYVEQRIKGFDDSRKQELFAYGLTEGYTRDELDRLTDPRLVVTLWKAQQWDVLQSSKPGITRKAAQAAPAVRPGAATPPVSRVKQLDERFRKARGTNEKKRTAEDYFAAKFGG